MRQQPSRRHPAQPTNEVVIVIKDRHRMCMVRPEHLRRPAVVVAWSGDSMALDACLECARSMLAGALVVQIPIEFTPIGTQTVAR